MLELWTHALSSVYGFSLAMRHYMKWSKVVFRMKSILVTKNSNSVQHLTSFFSLQNHSIFFFFLTPVSHQRAS